MAIASSGTTWAAQWGVRPLFVSRYSIENKLSTFAACSPSKMRALQSLSSSMFFPDSLHSLFNMSAARSPCYRRGSRLVVRAETDYYSVLGVSRNASKSEIKSEEGRARFNVYYKNAQRFCAWDGNMPEKKRAMKIKRTLKWFTSFKRLERELF